VSDGASAKAMTCAKNKDDTSQAYIYVFTFDATSLASGASARTKYVVKATTDIKFCLSSGFSADMNTAYALYHWKVSNVYYPLFV